MSIEAYAIQSTFGLNIAPAVAGMNEYIAILRRVVLAQKEVLESQRLITTAVRASATAAGAFADQMERAARAARAARNMVSGGAVAGAAAPGAAAAASSAPAAAVARSPTGGFVLLGAPYSSGNSLVPVGPGTQWEYASSGNRGTLANIPGGPSGFTMGGGGTPGGPIGPYTGGVPLNAPPAAGLPGGGRGPFPTVSAWMAAQGAQQVGQASSGFLGDMFEAGAAVDAQKQRLARQGMSPDQVGAAYAAAVKAQQDSLGTYVGQNLDTVILLMSLTQDAGAALKEMPTAARAASVMSGLGRSGTEELKATLRSAELRGLLMKEGETKADVPALNRFIRQAEDITALSGGRYGPSDLLQFLISSKAAGAMLQDKTLPGMLALIQAVGASQAGTALVGFSQQFSTGKMSDGAFKFLVESGIIQHPELARKIAIGYHQLLPGAMGTGDLEQARGDPGAFITGRILPAVRSYLEKNYGAAYTGGDERQKQQYEQATAAAWASRITGGSFMAEILRLAPLMLRDVRAAENQAKMGDPYDAVVANNPLMAQQGLQASMNALLVTLGQNNMATMTATLKGITSGLNELNIVLTKYPNAGKEILAIAAALAVLGTVAGVVLYALLPIMALRNLKNWAIPPGAAAAAGPALPGAGEGGFVIGALLKRLGIPLLIGSATKFGLDALDPENKMDQWADKHVPGYSWLDRKLNSLFGYGDQDNAHRAAAAKGGDLTVNLNIDGKTLEKHVLKGVVNGANGPQTGSGDFDGRRGYTQPEN